MTKTPHRGGTRRWLVRGASGAFVAALAWTALSQQVSATGPPLLDAPILSQTVIGLRQGASGDDVAAVQRALIAAGVPVRGGADGKFGPATRAAVVAFQAARGLAQTGEVDAPTASALGLSSSSSGGSATLQQGANGPAVVELQQKLMAAGVFVAGGADGVFGAATARALTQYQSWNGLTPSGVVDAATAAKLGLGTVPSAPTTPPPTSTPTPAPTNSYVGLSVGARGTAVKELQQQLIAAGVNVTGGADGVFGQMTRTALVSFQRARGFAQTGTVSDAEVTALGLGGATPPAPTPPPASTPTNPSNPYVGLAVGARGDLVRDLQRQLIANGVAVRGGADGVFGAATKAALEAYQQANGLGVSGVVFDATAAKLGLGTPTTPTPTTPAPTTPTPTNPYVGLAVGARGDLVAELQRALMDTGITVRGGADGVFGNATKTALAAFQRVNGIAETGVLTERGAQILGLGSTTTPTPTPTPPPSSGLVTATGYPVKGESSERVRVLQQALIAWGVNVVGGADGSFGNATAAAIRDFQGRNGLTVTGTVTQETADKLALAPSDPSPPPTASDIVLARFPVQGRCFFGNTWHAPRGNGRLHEGVDIIANEGNLLYAVVDGTITKMYWDSPGALAGNGLRVAQDNGTYFTYLHLSGFAPGIKVGTKVTAGDVIGFVGNTGNSSTPHLHFEVHPGGGAAVNPYPYVKAIDDCSNTTPRYQSSFT